MTDQNLGQAILSRLDAIDARLRAADTQRDLLLAAVHDLLQYHHLNASALRHKDAVAQLYEERAAVAAEILERQERDTEPPPEAP